MSEDPTPYNPDGLRAPPAKPAQPAVADLDPTDADSGLLHAALRKENEAQRAQLDAEANRAKAEAFDPKAPSIHDNDVTITAKAIWDAVTVSADRHGWVAVSPVAGTFKVCRYASPYSNFQAAVVKLRRAGIRVGEPQLAGS